MIIEDKNDYKNYLFQTIWNYRHPNGLVDEKPKSWREVFNAMKKDGVLPKKWYTPDAVRHFIERDPENVKLESHNEYLNQMLFMFTSKITVTNKDKFNMFFRNLPEDSRKNFMDWLAQGMMWNGIPVSNVCKVITKQLEVLGYMSGTDVRRYMPDKYKDADKQARKLGKTFEASGRIRKDESNG